MRICRLRRLRKTESVRELVSQIDIHPRHLILPYFVVEGKGIKRPIGSMPGVYHHSLDTLIEDIYSIGKINAVLLFGIPDKKDELGSSAYQKGGVIQRAIRSIKRRFKGLTVITDVCLCGFTTHGHCGIIEDNEVDNDKTLKALIKVALSYAEAGADFVAPSAMMDGQVGAIRDALDKNGFKDVGILSYSAKYASNFYSPFRDALDSTPRFGDRKGYQMDFRNFKDALREVEVDIQEGADIVMIKPALAYLDIIYKVKKRFNVPVSAYNVSGEYAMVKAICKGDKTLEENLALEILIAIKRAGADLIITYFAKDVMRWLKQ